MGTVRIVKGNTGDTPKVGEAATYEQEEVSRRIERVGGARTKGM
jgi:hypothetical protein